MIFQHLEDINDNGPPQLPLFVRQITVDMHVVLTTRKEISKLSLNFGWRH